MMEGLIHEHDFEHVHIGGQDRRNLVSCVTCGIVFCTLCGTSVPRNVPEMMHNHQGIAFDQVVVK